MFRPSRSSSGPSRKQIQALFSFPALWDPKCCYRNMKCVCVYIYIFPMPPHVLLVDFVVLPPGHGRNVTDF